MDTSTSQWDPDATVAPHWRPTLREPHPVRTSAVGVGAVGGGMWLLAFGLLASSLHGYLWWSLLSGLAAWAAAAVLARYGDRGVAVGIAAITGLSWTAPVIALIMNLGTW